MAKALVESQRYHLAVRDTFSQLLGCLNCEWRNSDKCPHSKEPGKDFVIPKKGICKMRVDWAKSHLPPYESMPSVDRLMLDMSKSFQSYRERSEFRDILDMEKQLVKAVDSNNDYEIDKLEVLLERRKKEFRAITEIVSKFRDRQVERDTPKKVELAVQRTIPLSTLHSIMRGETVDADFEEVKD